MKNFILSLALLFCVVLFTVINGSICASSLGEIIEEAQKLPDVPDENTLEKVKKLEKMWFEKSEYYSAVSKYDYINSVTKEIKNTESACISRDDGTYASARFSLIMALEYLRDTQNLRFDNLL